MPVLFWNDKLDTFIIFSGLPATGKSTTAQHLAQRIKSVYLRIDSIEQAIRSSGILGNGAEIGAAGYMAAYRIASDNLRMGHTVIADSVNPLKLTRDTYRDIAIQLGIDFLEVEVICSNKAEHRKRVETRHTSVEGLTLPTWAEVENRLYETWDRYCLRLDTAHLSEAECVERIVSEVGRRK